MADKKSFRRCSLAVMARSRSRNSRLVLSTTAPHKPKVLGTASKSPDRNHDTTRKPRIASQNHHSIAPIKLPTTK